MEISTHFGTFCETLWKPNLKFPVIRDGEHGNPATERLNPKLFCYLVPCILLGVILQSIYQERGLAHELWKSLIVVLLVWLGLGSLWAWERIEARGRVTKVVLHRRPNKARPTLVNPRLDHSEFGVLVQQQKDERVGEDGPRPSKGHSDVP